MELYIPKTVTVGFQKREGTFTGKLAYIVYTDNKGVLRKEASWNSWRDKKIDPITIDNVPTDEFTFNRGIQRSGYNWGSGRSVIRVHDSRDFEFEITVDNLIGILMHTDVSKRSITEKCVYAWHGKDLVLLPVNSEDYQKSIEFTNKIESKFSARELVVGRTYSAKRTKGDFIYIGRLPRWESNYISGGGYGYVQTKTNKHVFITGDGQVETFEPSSQIAGCINEEIYSDFANLYQTYLGTLGSQAHRQFEFSRLSITDIVTYRSTARIQNLVRRVSDTIYDIVDNYEYVDPNWASHKKLDVQQTIKISGADYTRVYTTIPDGRTYYFDRSNDKRTPAEKLGNPSDEVMEILLKDKRTITELDLDVLYNNGFGKIVRVFADGKQLTLGV